MSKLCFDIKILLLKVELICDSASHSEFKKFDTIKKIELIIEFIDMKAIRNLLKPLSTL
jgi:hypothetical protein